MGADLKSGITSQIGQRVTIIKDWTTEGNRLTRTAADGDRTRNTAAKNLLSRCRVVARAIAEGGSIQVIYQAQGRLRNARLPFLDVPEGQINPWFTYVRLFWNFVLKVDLGFSRHDQQTSVGQSFRKGNSPILPFKTK